MDSGTQRNHKSGYVLVDTVKNGLTQRDGNSSCRRLRAECREISRHHIAKHPERILVYEERRHHILKYEQEYVHDEYHTDNLDKHAEHLEHLARMGHVEEYAEDVDWQQRQHHHLYGLGDDIAELAEHVLQCLAVQMGNAQSERERHYQRSHDIERCRNGNSEIRLDAFSLTDLCYLQIVGNERWKEGLPHSIREEAGEYRCSISQ